MRLELINITKRYEEETVFEHLNMTFTCGLTNLSGDNGIGKTTLLKIISQQTPYDGEIIFNGQPLVNYQRSCCVLVSQDIKLAEDLSVKENIDFIVNGKENKDILLEKLGLTNLIYNKVKNLSGGERRKLSILIALLLQPKILLLDEIFTFLDSQTIELIKEQIIEYAKENIVILVDHNVSMAEATVCLNSKESFANESQINSSLDDEELILASSKLTKSFKINVIKNYLSPAIFVLCLINMIILFSFFVLQISKQDLISAYYIDNNCDYYTLDVQKSPIKGEYNRYYAKNQYIEENLYGFTYYTKLNFEVIEETAKHETYLNCLIPDYLKYEVGKVISNSGENYYIYGKFKTNAKDIYDDGILTTYDLSLSRLFIEVKTAPKLYDEIHLKLEAKEIKELFRQGVLMTNTFAPEEQYEQLNKKLFMILVVFLAIIFIGLSSFYSLVNAKKMKNRSDFLIAYSKNAREIFKFNFVCKIIIFSMLFLVSTIIASIVFKVYFSDFLGLTITYPALKIVLLEMICLIIFLILDKYINLRIMKKEIINE